MVLELPHRLMHPRLADGFVGHPVAQVKYHLQSRLPIQFHVFFRRTFRRVGHHAVERTFRVHGQVGGGNPAVLEIHAKGKERLAVHDRAVVAVDVHPTARGRFNPRKRRTCRAERLAAQRECACHFVRAQPEKRCVESDCGLSGRNHLARHCLAAAVLRRVREGCRIVTVSVLIEAEKRTGPPVDSLR